MVSSCPDRFRVAARHAGLQLEGLLASNVEHNNCCRQQQSSLGVREALEGEAMAGNSQMPRTAKSRASGQPCSGRKQAGNGGTQSDVMDDAIALDTLAGHAGYAVRRFQIWIFQDFIRTLGAVDIRPTQYSVMTVIGANPGLSQMAVAKRLGIERARLVRLLDSLEHRDLVSRVRSTTDRRTHALHLTTGGKTALAQFRRLAAEHERHVAEKIGKENRERLLQILSAFT
jgi:DNA-binding MarR family transcriptional regulator